MTTNGFMLPVYAEKLREAGLDRINISFHSLERESFQFITGTDSMDKVIDGIKAAKTSGIDPIKLNFVVLKGVNEDQIRFDNCPNKLGRLRCALLHTPGGAK